MQIRQFATHRVQQFALIVRRRQRDQRDARSVGCESADHPAALESQARIGRARGVLQQFRTERLSVEHPAVPRGG